jgi:hypothetical protein
MKLLTSMIALIILLAILLVSVVLSKEGFAIGDVISRGNVVLDTSKQSMFPYTTEPIDSLDQYEIEAVFQNEGDRELKKQEINRMTRRYPLDWTNYPPNSSKFQSEQAKYIEGFSADSSAEELSKPYEAIGVGNLTPPDMIAVEKDEQRILSTYAPKKADDLKTYDLEDAQELIEKIYKKKGMKATVERKEGNVFEIVGVRPLKEKIEYEDDLHDAQWSPNRETAAGEAEIEVPAVATETAAARDPYYEPTTSTRSDRSDYMKFTPGLERMFAPTYPTKDWINQPRDK